MRVVGGAVCKHFLDQFGISVGGYVASIGEIQAALILVTCLTKNASLVQKNRMCVVQTEASAQKMRDEIEKTIHGKNTLGGVLEIVALNLPVGLGSFMQWDKRLEAKLALAVMSVQAIKGVEVGDAFENAKRLGTQAHMTPSTCNFQTCNVQRIAQAVPKAESLTDSRSVIRAAMKPIATTLLPQPTVDLASGPNLPSNTNAPIFVPCRVQFPFLKPWWHSSLQNLSLKNLAVIP
jgi:chorismate synthase